jgi:hypothetical protein
MAAPGIDPILTHCGVVDTSGKLIPSGRAAFVADVIALLTAGNADGKGLLLAKALGVPVPPVGGPPFPAPQLVPPGIPIEPIFYFGPDPTAILSTPYLMDPKGLWSQIFVDGLYAAIATALNLPGSYVPPLFDPSIYGIDFSFKLPGDLPTLAAKLPTVLAPQIPKLILKLGVPSLPIPAPPAIPPIFSIPNFPPPLPIPPPINFGIGLAFPDLFIKFLAGIPSLIIPAVPTSLPDLFLKPFSVLLELFFKIAAELNLFLTSPKLLVATMLVIIQNVVTMIVCDIIGMILGSGDIVKAFAVFGGLSAG